MRKRLNTGIGLAALAVVGLACLLWGPWSLPTSAVPAPVLATPASYSEQLPETGSRASAERARRFPAPASTIASSQGSDDASLGLEIAIFARFVDEHDQPLATVRLSMNNGLRRLESISTTDGRAQFLIASDDRLLDNDLVLEFEKQGRIPVRRTLSRSLRESHDFGKVQLLPAGTLVGRVLDEQGMPVVAQISAAFSPAPMSESDRERQLHLGIGLELATAESRTETDGTFEVSGLPGGTFVIVARIPEHPRALSSPVDLHPGSSRSVGALVMREAKPANRIAGTVLTPEGVPFADGIVELWVPGAARNANPTAARTRTGENGMFVFSVPSRSRFHVVLVDERTREERIRLNNVVAGGAPVQLVAPEVRIAQVRVSSSSGAAIEGAFIAATDLDGVGIRLEPTSPEPGLWRFPVPTRPFQLSVGAPGHELEHLSAHDPTTIESTLELTLRPTRVARIRGVVSRDGVPVAGAKVAAYRRLEGPHRLSTGFGTRVEASPISELARTDKSGHFELANLRERALVLLVRHGGEIALEFGPVPVDRGDTVWKLPLPMPGEVRGRVLLAEGRDPRGLIIGASRGDGEVRAMSLEADGNFHFARLAPGDWQVRCIEPGLGRVSDRTAHPSRTRPRPQVRLASGESTEIQLDLRYQERRHVRGYITAAPDGPTRWTMVLDGREVRVGPDGRFSAELFTARRPVRLALRGAYGPSVSLLVEDRLDLDSEDNEWNLDLRTGVLELHSVPAFDIHPARGGSDPVKVKLEQSGPEGRRTTIDVSAHGGGPLVLRGLPVGLYDLHFRDETNGRDPDGAESCRTSLELLPGEHKVVSVR